jgi:hypothetical protein
MYYKKEVECAHSPQRLGYELNSQKIDIRFPAGIEYSSNHCVQTGMKTSPGIESKA